MIGLLDQDGTHDPNRTPPDQVSPHHPPDQFPYVDLDFDSDFAQSRGFLQTAAPLHVMTQRHCPSLTIRWHKPSVMAGFLLSLPMAVGPAAVAETFEGFTEPFRVVNVATTETGVVASVKVREGDFVKKGQELAKLDNDVHLTVLAIAAEQMKAAGRLQSAQSEFELQQNKLDKLTLLRENGHARQEEVERTRADVAIAKSQVLTIQEELAIRKLEHEKASLQLARRTIRAPLDGVITKSIKFEGEFVAPNDPVLFTIAKLDPLLANFSVPSSHLATIGIGREVEVVIEASGNRVRGIVEMISPVTDAGSSTVPIKVRLDNSKGLFRSGERCLLEIPSRPDAAAQ